MLSQQAE
jgi:galactitol-specific phosphotransferase system IIB component